MKRESEGSVAGVSFAANIVGIANSGLWPRMQATSSGESYNGFRLLMSATM